MSFPKSVSDKALVDCGRCCCICHKFCGTKIELHHIVPKADGGLDTFENCIPLCFDCHSDMGKVDSNHPKGKSYSAIELKAHRDRWYSERANTGACQTSEVFDADKRRFDEICKRFNYDIQDSLRDCDFRGTIPIYIFNPLDSLIYENQDSGFEFLNQEMESYRLSLFGSLKKFLQHYNHNIFHIENDLGATHLWLLEQEYIPRGDEDYDTFYNEHYAMFYAEAMKLNELATDVWEKYICFVRHGRKLFQQ